MRIISGTARGTKLFTLDGENTRPTLDRVKEPLFNIINFELEDAVVLDLFAGSGALGLEALSRGAQKAIFCEKNYDSVKVIKQNIEKTKFTSKSVLIKGDFTVGLKHIQETDTKIDIIFLDPPYKTDYVFKSLEIIKKYEILNEGGTIIVETDEIERINKELKTLEIEAYDTRKYGRVYLIFIRLDLKKIRKE